MADIVIEVIAEITGGTIEVVQETGAPSISLIEVLVEGPQGPPGNAGGSGYNELVLNVVSNGQTDFAIPTAPTKSVLLIEGIEYYETKHYSITTVGVNVHLVWLNNGFTLAPTDFLLFKYI